MTIKETATVSQVSDFFKNMGYNVTITCDYLQADDIKSYLTFEYLADKDVDVNTNKERKGQAEWYNSTNVIIFLDDNPVLPEKTYCGFPKGFLNSQPYSALQLNPDIRQDAHKPEPALKATVQPVKLQLN